MQISTWLIFFCTGISNLNNFTKYWYEYDNGNDRKARQIVTAEQMKAQFDTHLASMVNYMEEKMVFSGGPPEDGIFKCMYNSCYVFSLFYVSKYVFRFLFSLNSFLYFVLRFFYEIKWRMQWKTKCLRWMLTRTLKYWCREMLDWKSIYWKLLWSIANAIDCRCRIETSHSVSVVHVVLKIADKPR